MMEHDGGTLGFRGNRRAPQLKSTLTGQQRISPGIWCFSVANGAMSIINSRLAVTQSNGEKFHPSTIGQNRITSEYRNSSTFPLSECPDPLLGQQIDAVMYHAIALYRSLHSTLVPLESSGAHLLRYEIGQSYLTHSDASVNFGPRGGVLTRRATAILYTNDDYQGGELEFPHFNLKIKPTAGTILVFPADFVYEHVAHPVTSGTKYAVVDFFISRIAPWLNPNVSPSLTP